jgi:hypothetical protein
MQILKYYFINYKFNLYKLYILFLLLLAIKTCGLLTNI